MTQPLPAPISDADLASFVTNALNPLSLDGGAGDAGADGGADPAWPAPALASDGSSQTIYTLYIPSSTQVTFAGTPSTYCQYRSFGYHTNAEANGLIVAYAVVLQCPTETDVGVEQAASHELIEAATNPVTELAIPHGYVGFDANHLAWELQTDFQDELGDACEDWSGSFYQETGGFPYGVQRIWSNAAALAEHNPCVPAPAGAYHGMTLFPSQQSIVTANLNAGGRGKAMTRGFNVSINVPLTFQVGFFSDGPTSPWTIASAFPETMNFYTQAGAAVGNGAVTIDKTSGQDGDKANVTVTVTMKGPAGFHVMAITWDPPPSTPWQPRYLPILLVDD